MAESPLVLQITAEDLASAILGKVAAEVRKLAPAATQATSGLNTLTGATQKSTTSTTGLSTALKGALYQTGQTSAGAQQFGQSLKGASDHASTGAKAVDALSGKTAQAHGSFLASAKSALGFGQGLGTAGATGDKLASSLSGVVSGLVLFTGATLGISAGVKAIGDFQQSLANVSTLVDTSKVSISGFRDQILQLPPALGDSTDLVKGLYQALSAGVAPAQALTLVTSAAKLAQAGLTDTKTSVDVLTTAINAYGLKASESARLSDQLFETVIIGKTEVKDLASNLGSAIPIAAALGVSFSDLNATVATLTQGGLSTAEAVTAVRSAFTNMIQNAEKFRAVGIDVTKVLAEEGITGLFKRLTSATEGSAEGIRKLIPDAQGLVGALALVGNQSGILADAQARVAGAVGTTDLAVQKQAQTIPKALTEVGTAFKQLELTLTQEFAEAAVPALHAVRDAVLDIKSFTPVIKQAFAGTAADIVGFAGTTLLAFAKVGEFVDRQADKIGLLTKTNKKFTADARAFAEDLIKQSAEVRRGIELEIDANGKKAASQGKAVQEQQKFIDISKVLVGQVAAGAASADLFRTSAIGLAGEFGGLGEKASGASSGVEKLGSTQDQTQSKTGQLLEGVRGLAKELGFGKTQADLFESGIKLITPPLTEAAKASGITTDELRGMVKSFAELALPAAELQKQLNAIGITEKQLSGETATLTAAQIRAADAQGLSVTNALALLSAYQDLSPQLIAQSAALQKAGVDVAKLTQNVAALTEITKNYGATAAEIEAAFKRTFGIGVQESQRFATQLAKDMVLVSNAGEATGAATLDAFEQSVQKIIETFGKLSPAVAKEFDRIAEKGAGVSGDVVLAFRTLSERTPLELQRLADKALIAFETIQQSGIASPREIARFWVEDVVPRILDAAGELPPGLERINDKLVAQAKEAGVQVRDALIDPYAQLGIKAPIELQRVADKAREAFDQIKASGDLTTQQLAKVFVEDLAPKLIDGFGKIPPEWQKDARELVRIAREAGEYISPALEKAIGDGTKQGVKRALGALDELGQGLAVAGEKARVVFQQSFAAGSAGLLSQLREQQAQLADIPDIVQSAFSGGNSTLESRTAYTKQLTKTTLDAIELIVGKLKALGFDAQGNPLASRSPLANPFDKISTGAKEATQAPASRSPDALVRDTDSLSGSSRADESSLTGARRSLQAEENARKGNVQADSLKLDRDFAATQQALQAESLASSRSFADQKKVLAEASLQTARDFADKLKALDRNTGTFASQKDALEQQAENEAAAAAKATLQRQSIESARTFADDKRALDAASLKQARAFTDELAQEAADHTARMAAHYDTNLDAARAYADELTAVDQEILASKRSSQGNVRSLQQTDISPAAGLTGGSGTASSGTGSSPPSGVSSSSPAGGFLAARRAQTAGFTPNGVSSSSAGAELEKQIRTLQQQLLDEQVAKLGTVFNNDDPNFNPALTQKIGALQAQLASLRPPGTVPPLVPSIRPSAGTGFVPIPGQSFIGGNQNPNAPVIPGVTGLGAQPEAGSSSNPLNAKAPTFTPKLAGTVIQGNTAILDGKPYPLVATNQNGGIIFEVGTGQSVPSGALVYDRSANWYYVGEVGAPQQLGTTSAGKPIISPEQVRPTTGPVNPHPLQQRPSSPVGTGQIGPPILDSVTGILIDPSTRRPVVKPPFVPAGSGETGRLPGFNIPGPVNPLPLLPQAPGFADRKPDLGVADRQVAGASKLLAIFNETGNQEIRKYLNALQEGLADNADQIAFNTHELQQAGTTFEAFHTATGESAVQLKRQGEVVAEYTLSLRHLLDVVQDLSPALQKQQRVLADSIFEQQQQLRDTPGDPALAGSIQATQALLALKRPLDLGPHDLPGPTRTGAVGFAPRPVPPVFPAPTAASNEGNKIGSIGIDPLTGRPYVPGVGSLNPSLGITRLQGFAQGGIVQGSGGTDSVLIRATPGERVQTKEQADASDRVLGVTFGAMAMNAPQGTGEGRLWPDSGHHFSRDSSPIVGSPGLVNARRDDPLPALGSRLHAPQIRGDRTEELARSAESHRIAPRTHAAPPTQSLGPVQRFAQGGIVQGNGGTDSVLIRATPGERVSTPQQDRDRGPIQITIYLTMPTLVPDRIAMQQAAQALVPALEEALRQKGL